MLPDLSGRSFTTAIRWILRDGFLFHNATAGGYREFRHPDGSTIWIRPDGEIVRLGHKVTGTKYRQRYDQWGSPTASHNTGEKIAV